MNPRRARKAYEREEVFKGKHADTAPDIPMEPVEQYSLTHEDRARRRRLDLSGGLGSRA